MPLDSERVKHEYFHLATHYYTAARYSARAALTPVCGNLFHHAIELYMKGALSEHMSTKKLKGLRHKLRNTWARFKVEFPDASLERFDGPIRALDEFESIRYPEKLVGEGAVCVFTFERFDAARMASYSPGSAPSYVLMITELDALVGLIFEKAQLNRAAFFFNNPGMRGGTSKKPWSFDGRNQIGQLGQPPHSLGSRLVRLAQGEAAEVPRGRARVGAALPLASPNTDSQPAPTVNLLYGAELTAPETAPSRLLALRPG